MRHHPPRRGPKPRPARVLFAVCGRAPRAERRLRALTGHRPAGVGARGAPAAAHSPPPSPNTFFRNSSPLHLCGPAAPRIPRGRGAAGGAVRSAAELPSVPSGLRGAARRWGPPAGPEAAALSAAARGGARGGAAAGPGGSRRRGAEGRRGGALPAPAPLSASVRGGAGAGTATRPTLGAGSAAHHAPGSRGSPRAAGVSGAGGAGRGQTPLLRAARRARARLRLLSRGRGGAGQHDRGLPPRCAGRQLPGATLMLRVPALQI